MQQILGAAYIREVIYGGKQHRGTQSSQVLQSVGWGKKNNDSIWKIFLDISGSVMNTFTVCVEKHARASVNGTKLISIAQFLVNVEDTVPKSKKVKC